MRTRARWARLGGDAALVLGCAALLAFWQVRIAESWGARYGVAEAACALATCGPAVARRRPAARAGADARRAAVWLVVCAGAGIAVGVVAVLAAWLGGYPAGPGPATALGLYVLVGSAAARLPMRPALVVAAGGLVVAAGSVLGGHTAAGVPPVLTLNGAAWLAAVAYAAGVRLLAARRRATAARVRRAERLRLARELHDVVGHHITAIILRTQSARLQADRARVPQGPALQALPEIAEVGSAALDALRQVVGVLRGADAPDVPAPGALRELIAAYEGPPVRARIPDDMDWPPEITATVYRVVQEGLTNAARHAPGARTVTVDVTEDAGTLTVEVADDAPQPLRPRRPGHGLLGMRERVEALGGTLRTGPRGDSPGWLVRAAFPTTPASLTAPDPAPAASHATRGPDAPGDPGPAPPGAAR